MPLFQLSLSFLALGSNRKDFPQFVLVKHLKLQRELDPPAKFVFIFIVLHSGNGIVYRFLILCKANSFILIV